MKDLKERCSEEISGKRKITRKEALKKTGFIAFSAATMMILLNKPGKAQDGDSSYSPDDPDTW